MHPDPLLAYPSPPNHSSALQEARNVSQLQADALLLGVHLPGGSLLDHFRSVLHELLENPCSSKTSCAAKTLAWPSSQDPAAAASLDIEHLEGGEGAPRIEMDLACGVVDLQDQAAVEAAEARLAGRNVVDPSGADARQESVSDSDSDSGGSGSIGADSGKPDSCAQGSGRSSLERFKDHPPPSAQAEADGAGFRHGKPAGFDPDKRRRTATKKRRKIEEL